MLYPTLPTQQSSRDMIQEFRGYNHNLRIGSGEFYDMQNMTSDDMPVLSPRARRGVFAKPASPQGLIAKESLCYVDGSDFVVGNERVAMGLSTAREDCPKELVSMGAYVIILPDKRYINTADLTDFGAIEASYESAGTVTFSASNIDGDAIGAVTEADTAPEDPGNLQYWLDTSVKPNVLKRYAATTKTWTSIATTYVKISAPGIGKNFQRYDGVTIEGVTVEGLKDLNATIPIYAREEDWIVVVGVLGGIQTQTGKVTIRRQMPNMDFIIESGNRLWGCRYGIAQNGEMVNEIYASKLGDFRNWNVFMGVSTDSYAASCGTDGAFTGAVAHLGYPIFWKEGYLHKVFGSIPSNFQIQTTACRGVQPGCHKSLAIVNEVLYYKARSGVCAYDGSLPTEISGALGTEQYSQAVAGGHGNKYYISMRGREGWALLVYDTAKGVWHKEDDLQAGDFASFQGELYCVDAANRNIITMLGSGEAYEETVPWMVQTGNLGLDTPDRKYVARMSVRMNLDPGSVADVYIQYDLDGQWIHLCRVHNTRLRGFHVPIRPRRCDHMALKIVGQGPGKIYSISKVIEEGSDFR